jgi:hypothetical protein
LRSLAFELETEYFDSKPEAIEPMVDHEELEKGYIKY